MLNLYELEQFVLFAETGSLTEAAKRLHISAPTLSRSMQNIETTFGVTLFHRSKNRLTLNATGEKAVKYSRLLLSTASDTLNKVKEYDKSLQTISVKSCAPAPLWKLLPMLSISYPSMTIASSICDMDEINHSISEESYDILILPHKTDRISESSQFFYMEEHLSVCIRKDHELASKDSVTTKELNGYNFLVRSELGFWDSICREAMPVSKFLVQTDEFEYNELVKNSSLPSFVTDAALEHTTSNIPPDRIAIPITDAEVNVSFYIAVKNTDKYRLLLSKFNQSRLP